MLNVKGQNDDLTKYGQKRSDRSTMVLCRFLCTPWVKKVCHPNHGYNFVNSEAEAVCRQCLQILTAETIKMLKFRTN